MGINKQPPAIQAATLREKPAQKRAEQTNRKYAVFSFSVLKIGLVSLLSIYYIEVYSFELKTLIYDTLHPFFKDTAALKGLHLACNRVF